MELTYKVRGTDLKEYGPVALAELVDWLRQNRVSGDSEVMRSDMDYWSAARSFSELQGALPSGGQMVAPLTTGAQSFPMRGDPAAEAQLKSGASWFYWIGGLSLINSLVTLSGSEWGFILGLGITKIIDAFALGFETAGKGVALGLDLLVVGTFVFFGIFANKRKTWAFIVGMALYGLDSLFSLLVQDWLSLGFHGFALFCLFRGLKACRELNAS